MNQQKSDSYIDLYRNQIRQYHKEMRDLTIKFCVSEKRYDKIVEKLDYYNDFEIESLWDWLRIVRFREYSDFFKVYLMVPNPKETWDNYEKFGIKDLPEQAIMERVKFHLKEYWKTPFKSKRKIIIKNGKKNKSNNVESNIIGVPV